MEKIIEMFVGLSQQMYDVSERVSKFKPTILVNETTHMNRILMIKRLQFLYDRVVFVVAALDLRHLAKEYHKPRSIVQSQ